MPTSRRQKLQRDLRLRNAAASNRAQCGGVDLSDGVPNVTDFRHRWGYRADRRGDVTASQLYGHSEPDAQ